MEKFFTFKELCAEMGWESATTGIEKQITYAKAKGILIEKAFKKGTTYFQLIQNNLKDTEWKTYPKNTKFEVDKSGLVRNKKTKKIVSHSDGKGYLQVCDSEINVNYLVHRMVMETFNPIENSDDYVVDHINGIKDDDRIENLRWVSQRQNSLFRDENFAKISINLQKLIEKKGYEWVNDLLELQLRN